MLNLITKAAKLFALLLLTCNLLLATCNLFAQQPTQEWVARYDGPCSDLYGPFFCVDGLGNSYVAGTHVVNDSINILCVKYNSSGVQQWATLYKYPGYRYYAPTGLAIDSQGNAYVTSIYALGAAAVKNIITLKFSVNNGAVLWVRTYLGQYQIQTESSDIKIDKQNNLYVVGWADSSMLCIKYNVNGDSLWVRQLRANIPSVIDAAFSCTFDDSLNILMTGQRRYLFMGGGFDTALTVKYNTNGVFRWSKTYHFDNLINRGYKIICDQNGNAYVGGLTRISGYLVYLTLKYDKNGNQQWAKIYDAPGSGDNNLKGIAMDRINNALFVTGGATVNGSQVAATIKYNIVTGDSVWVRNDTGTYSRANSSAIRVDSSGNIYTTGGTYNLGLSPFDVITRKYSEQSSPLWLMTYNGPFNGIDFGIDLALDNFKNIYVLTTSESSSGLNDYVVIKYNQLLGIRPISNEIPYAFNLKQNYPNPFNPNTRIGFSIPKRSFVELRIYDILGRLKELPLSQYVNASEYELTLNCSSYSSGTYFYQLITDGNIVDTKKLIVLK